jgi:IS5 family transposase
MKQQTLAVAASFERFVRSTRRSEFLSQRNVVVPWSELLALIEPHYPKAGNGCPPVGRERMLRIYFLQQWFNLSDPAVEDALYDSVTMRSFVGIDLGREPAPAETTVCAGEVAAKKAVRMVRVLRHGRVPISVSDE